MTTINYYGLDPREWAKLVMLAGAISDGCTVNRTCCISNNHEGIRRRIAHACDILGFEHREERNGNAAWNVTLRRSGHKRWNGEPWPYRDFLKSYDLWGVKCEGKNFPEELFDMSPLAKLVFVCYYMDHDGSFVINERGYIVPRSSFRTRRQAEDFRRLLEGAGIRVVSVRERKSFRQNTQRVHTEYVVSITMKDTFKFKYCDKTLDYVIEHSQGKGAEKARVRYV